MPDPRSPLSDQDTDEFANLILAQLVQKLGENGAVSLEEWEKEFLQLGLESLMRGQSDLEGRGVSVPFPRGDSGPEKQG